MFKRLILGISLLVVLVSVNANAMEVTPDQKVFVMGPRQGGKGALVHLMMDKELIATMGMGWDITPSEKLSNIEVGIYPHERTKEISEVIDSNHDRVIYDCPGFKQVGVKSEEADFPKAAALHQALEGNIRIILVMHEMSFENHRGADLALTLNRLTEMFPDQDELKKMLSLVISHKHCLNIPEKLEWLANCSPTLSTDRTIDLMTYFLQNPDRIGIFNNPTKVGSYKVSESLKTVLNRNDDYVSNPKVTMPVKESIVNEDKQSRWSSSDSYYLRNIR